MYVWDRAWYARKIDTFPNQHYHKFMSDDDIEIIYNKYIKPATIPTKYPGWLDNKGDHNES